MVNKHKFSETPIINKEVTDIDLIKGTYGNNITILTTDVNNLKSIGLEIYDFQEQVTLIIDDIISSGVDYFERTYSIKEKDNTEIEDIGCAMLLRAHGMEAAFEFLNDDDQGEVTIDQCYMLEAIKIELSAYKNVIIETLISKHTEKNKKDIQPV